MPRTNSLRRRTRAFNSNPKDSVRKILHELAEAEIAGDISATRSLLNLLEDRTAIPAKAFIFHDDTRPGYFGTWTRISSTIRPRRPFSRDVIAVDYSYDSSEEWEEENPGDADDIADDNDDDDEGDPGDDSDVDSWLVDDDDVGAVAPVDGVDEPPLPKRRLEGASGTSSSYKKRRVVPLVPFVKGPVWDPAITRTVEEVFTPFCIRFFNGMLLVALLQVDSPTSFSLDNPCPMDPFTYLSPLEKTPQPATNRTFLVPVFPEHVHSASNEPQANTPSVVKRPPLGPKHPFPEAHIPILVARINELATGSIVLIVETLYQELKDHKVKKNSIEAKVRELAVKKGKVWVAKQDIHFDGSTMLETT
jgi:chromatin assembly factor 1 subunit A